MAIKIATFPAVTLTSGQATACYGSALALHTLTIQAEDNNTGNIYVGDETVSTTSGVIVPPGGSVDITASVLNQGRSEEFLISEVYCTTGTTGNKVRLIGFRRRN
jgi:hypothetical protein